LVEDIESTWRKTARTIFLEHELKSAFDPRVSTIFLKRRSFLTVRAMHGYRGPSHMMKSMKGFICEADRRKLIEKLNRFSWIRHKIFSV